MYLLKSKFFFPNSSHILIANIWKCGTIKSIDQVCCCCCCLRMNFAMCILFVTIMYLPKCVDHPTSTSRSKGNRSFVSDSSWLYNRHCPSSECPALSAHIQVAVTIITSKEGRRWMSIRCTSMVRLAINLLKWLSVTLYQVLFLKIQEYDIYTYLSKVSYFFPISSHRKYLKMYNKIDWPGLLLLLLLLLLLVVVVCVWILQWYLVYNHNVPPKMCWPPHLHLP